MHAVPSGLLRFFSEGRGKCGLRFDALEDKKKWRQFNRHVRTCKGKLTSEQQQRLEEDFEIATQMQSTEKVLLVFTES